MIYSESKVRGYIVFFLIFSFLIVLTSFVFLLLNGKTISPSGQIENRGIVRINSVPENVEVYINGERASLTGKIIQNIELGEVDIRLEKEGFESWEKKVVVESGFVKDVFAQLFPENLNLQQISSLNIDKITYSEDANYAYFTVINSEINDEIGLWGISFESRFLDFNGSTEPEKIATFSATQINNLKNNAYFLNLSQNRDRVVLDIPAAQSLTSYDTNNSDTFDDLVEIIGFYPEKYTWFDGSRSLLIEDNNILYELNLSSMEKKLVALSNSASQDVDIIYCAKNNKLYYVDPFSSNLFKFENGRPEMIGDISEFRKKTITSLNCSPDNSEIVYANTETGLYFLDLKSLYAEVVVESPNVGILDISDDGSNILFATEEQLYSYRIEAVSSAPIYSSVLSELGVLAPNVNVSLSANFINIIKVELITPIPAEFEISISDTEGENIQSLLTENVDPNSVTINKDGSKLYVVVDDSSREGTVNKNLYRVELK